MIARRAIQVVIVVVAALLVAACGGKDTSDSTPRDDEGGDADRTPSLLVIDGDAVGAANPVGGMKGSTEADGRVVRETDAAADDEEEAAEEQEYEPIPLLPDGTIDDGDDPYDAEFVPVLAMPIEDDPYTTSTIEAAAMQLRRVDSEQWAEWMAPPTARSPWQQGADPITDSLVEVTVERCGGARHVATGVVLDDETVVTNVHVVENAAKRIRVGRAASSIRATDPRRLPAMIRYLDIDDDIAVLRVPGLTQPEMLWHQAIGTAPAFGYAFGVGQGGRSGTLRRVPVMASMQEETITVEQPDGFAEEITDRPVQTVVGGISSGFSGGIIASTNDPTLQAGWGFHGILRARMGLRADTAGIVVPQRIVEEALAANDGLPEWFEIRPGGCPQWHR